MLYVTHDWNKLLTAPDFIII